jgi:FRG domain-containing protein
MAQPQKSITSVADLLQRLSADIPNGAKHLWFRGHADERWLLVPSLGRKIGRVKAEAYLIKKFRQNATLLMNHPPAGDWDWLFIMQHHGVPTRLLDWTESPLIALYFAVSEKPKQDGALWCLLPTGLNSHSKIKPEYSSDIPSIEDPVITNYSPKTLVGEASSRLDPIAILAPRNTPRIQAQLGVFTIMHRDATAVDEVGDKKHAWCYSIPKQKKPALMKELSLLGITQFTLFPELPSIGAMLARSL